MKVGGKYLAKYSASSGLQKFAFGVFSLEALIVHNTTCIYLLALVYSHSPGRSTQDALAYLKEEV